MLSVVIKEQNSHFEHGLKIIITRLTEQWHQEIQFLPVDVLDTADIAFVSLDEDWFSADCYQVPLHTRHQQRIIICNKIEKEKLMFRPCLYMLPHIYREDDVDEITRKMVLILQKRALRHRVPPAICHYCTTRHFSILERQLLKFIAKGYPLAESAEQLSLTEEQTKSLRRRIMRKLHIKNDQQFLNYIRVNLNFLQE
ncbi:fimbria biosynthesis transcriptional regulator FimW [Citrobacter sp. Awk 4]|uniref:fimbria biosynthesis transcriptional regulator FimW n=1 Tax=Citrobacter sp. Awk 4 TaxID=2963955 RepID=UPI002303D1D8|nr:fimbria biosynthesis transcriptional regulator FimW [Citrobacter sp. Awk 4]MDA8477596.1 fimbria biosynthesis transcriptional regulator FimW [Citrobacter sp. Awk 4]